MLINLNIKIFILILKIIIIALAMNNKKSFIPKIPSLINFNFDENSTIKIESIKIINSEKPLEINLKFVKKPEYEFTFFFNEIDVECEKMNILKGLLMVILFFEP
jgi:hypothetical protein